jgi:GNAT superfamily N-acetyltransferase
MTVQLIDEFKLNNSIKKQIIELLKVSFPEENYNGRTYFKQLPHYRLLLKNKGKLMGQLGLDYRVMLLNEQPIRVLGVIDFAIFPEYQGQGLGTYLLSELDNIVKKHGGNIDFLLLVADKHHFYERCGYTLIKQKVKWLTLEEHINYGIQERTFDDCLMIKQIGKKTWGMGGELDMFGYWY